MPLQACLRETGSLPVYQRIGPSVAVLRDRGLSVAAIARHFRVDHHTADKALSWFLNVSSSS